MAKTYDNVHVVVASHKDMDFDSAKVFKEIADAYHLKGAEVPGFLREAACILKKLLNLSKRIGFPEKL